MRLDRRATVLQGVFLGDNRIGQLARLAKRHKPHSQLMGHGRAKEKPPRLDPNNNIRLEALDVLRERPNHFGKGGRVGKNGSNVFEDNPRLREIGNITNQSGCFHVPILQRKEGHLLCCAGFDHGALVVTERREALGEL